MTTIHLILSHEINEVLELNQEDGGMQYDYLSENNDGDNFNERDEDGNGSDGDQPKIKSPKNNNNIMKNR